MDSPKGKEEKTGKTWKGKMVKKFKRYGSSSNAPVEMLTGNFAVPLDQCVPSTVSEVGLKKSITYLCLHVISVQLREQSLFTVGGDANPNIASTFLIPPHLQLRTTYLPSPLESHPLKLCLPLVVSQFIYTYFKV